LIVFCHGVQSIILACQEVRRKLLLVDPDFKKAEQKVTRDIDASHAGTLGRAAVV
jgi:hypothetical protein